MTTDKSKTILPNPLPKGFKPNTKEDGEAMLDRMTGKDMERPSKGDPYWGRSTGRERG